MDYLKALQYIAHVDSNDAVIGKIERWEAHKKGILHRAFTLTIKYKGHILLQHRKHPVFDGIYDSTISSHPVFIGEDLQDTMDAVYLTLQREWDIQKKDLAVQPHYKGKCYYQAKDTHSPYQEHEICYVYECDLSHIKLPNFDTAYGFSLQPIDQIKDPNNILYPLLAPWVKKMIEEELL